MMTDRGKRHSVINFHKPILNKNETLPSIGNKRISIGERAHSNKNLLLMRKTNYKIFDDIDDNQKNILTERNQKYLDQKIIKLINCYKDLKFSEEQKNSRFKRLSLKGNSHNKNLTNLNILSKSLTKTYKIPEQLEKEGVKKLDEWDKNNLAQLYGNSNIIYNFLNKYYKKIENFDKIDELNYYKSIINSNGEELEEIIVGKNNNNNKIIKNFLDLKVKEQTYILRNSIAKSQSKFHKTLLFVKEKKIAMNLGIDNETLAEIRKDDDQIGYNYDKVIKDIDKKEMIKKEELKNELDKEIKKLSVIKEYINENFEVCKNEITYLKLVYINLVKSQRNYYLDLLKKGYDVRTEGLIWVVKRLLEIQTKLEYHHFPKFLDNSQIKYIIEMANLSLEETQLKTILKIIEKKRYVIQKNVSNKVIDKIVELSKIKNRHRASVFTLEMEKIKNRLKQEDSDTKIFDTFEKIYRKYKTIFLNKSLKREEEMKIKKIIEELKTSLMEGGGTTTTENFQQLTGILNYLNENKESKEYLVIILLIKFRLNYIHKLRENLRKEQLNKFNEEMDNNKNNRFFNAELSLRLDLVKSALFGNKI